MLYASVVALTMFILPLGSIAIAIAGGRTDWLWLTGEWFVFWGVGVRLLLAGLRQYFQPQFTTRDILKIDSEDAFLFVRELGGANLAAGVVGVASLAAPAFVTPSALGATISYAIAAGEHLKTQRRETNETIALVSDIFIAVVLAAFLIGEATHRLT